jgi:biopolymer transport protein ExbD
MSMSVGQEEEGAAISEINTTPLVDIMLVLLIIFLITVPVIKQMAQVDIPKAVNIPNQTKPENITIAVDSKGQVYWNAELVKDRSLLFSRLVAAARTVPQPEVQIRGDKNARFEAIGGVMFTLQRAGIVKVAFVTEPDRGSIRVTR